MNGTAESFKKQPKKHFYLAGHVSKAFQSFPKLREVGGTFVALRVADFSLKSHASVCKQIITHASRRAPTVFHVCVRWHWATTTLTDGANVVTGKARVSSLRPFTFNYERYLGIAGADHRRGWCLAVAVVVGGEGSGGSRCWSRGLE
jgi:hypothetical protein